MDFDFDVVINRVGTQSSKWDTMQAKYGVSPETGIAMWVADMDFMPPPAVNDVVRQAATVSYTHLTLPTIVGV